MPDGRHSDQAGPAAGTPESPGWPLRSVRRQWRHARGYASRWELSLMRERAVKAARGPAGHCSPGLGCSSARASPGAGDGGLAPGRCPLLLALGHPAASTGRRRAGCAVRKGKQEGDEALAECCPVLSFPTCGHGALAKVSYFPS